MEITSATSTAAAAVSASNGGVQNTIALGLVTGTSHLASTEMSILMSSLGVGTNVDIHA